ncbi:MAG: PEP-utilizing enzyme [Candidatus Dormibacteraeota bacterium]|nr:PEP-utilizing enzyme [Candidatus Dormibacteraeota bacterium]
MPERTLTGFAAAPGLAAGPAVFLAAGGANDGVTVPLEARHSQLDGARQALAAAAAELERIAADLLQQGRAAEAEIVETGALMAHDPGLGAAVSELVLNGGLSAASAINQAAEAAADQLAALPDPVLAERADDVRSLGRRAATIAAGGRAERAQGVLVAAGLGPADVAELGPQVQGVALAGGGVTAHAAIVARSLGLPMVVGLGREVLELMEGETVVVDGSLGRLVRYPEPERLADAGSERERRNQARATAVARRLEPAVTRDGRRVTVLANASSVAEVREALEQGAEGVGLLRTELLFLAAQAWPDVETSFRFLAPLLASLPDRVATVRLFDFGGDKTPPFLTGAEGRGIELLLQNPQALRDQLEAILRAGREVELRILVPMVTRLEQVVAVRQALLAVLGDRRQPALGAMIETPEAAHRAPEFASRLDFLSLGTNDLTQLALGLDRESSGTSPATHPAVLRLIDATMQAGREAGIPIEVCGEAASDTAALPLLVGLGADELSVGAARVGEVREALRSLSFAACQESAQRSLLGQAGHAGGEGL